MGTGCRTTRLWIPHTLADGCRLAGDLEQVDPEQPTRGRKVALVRITHSCETYAEIDYIIDTSWNYGVF